MWVVTWSLDEEMKLMLSFKVMRNERVFIPTYPPTHPLTLSHFLGIFGWCCDTTIFHFPCRAYCVSYRSVKPLNQMGNFLISDAISRTPRFPKFLMSQHAFSADQMCRAGPSKLISREEPGRHMPFWLEDLDLIGIFDAWKNRYRSSQEFGISKKCLLWFEIWWLSTDQLSIGCRK